MKHKIVEMGWQEAYPAAAGCKCTVCGRYELNWGVLGRDGGKKPLAELTNCPGKNESTITSKV